MPLQKRLLLLVTLLLSLAGVGAVAGVQPVSGPLYGGTAITITGSSFDASATVYVDGNTATNVVVVNGTTITAVTPEGYTEGPVDVDVETTNDYVSFPGAFAYVAPTISAVVPSEGSIIGGTDVTISGALFTDGMLVSFDGNPALNVTVVDANTITSTTPEGFGEGPVSVDIEYQSSLATLPSGFTYRQPRIDSITPASGSVNGGTAVTLTGAYFASDVTIDFDGISATGVTFVDSATVTAVTPPGVTGQVFVDLSIGGGTGYTSTTFTYLDPGIASINPSSGPESGGTAVTITGILFDPVATVEFDGISASNVVVVNSNTITATTPGGVGTVDVTVTTDYSQATLSQGFTYTAIPPPQIGGITPQSGESSGGTTVTVTGTGFQPGASASLGGSPLANLVVADSATLTGDTPALPVGAHALTVTNPDGQFDTLGGAFTVTQGPQGLPAGDLAPKGSPDGELNAADLLVLQRLVLGLETPTSYELLAGDVAPLNSPDGQLNAGDLVVLQRAVMGEIALPPVFDSNAPQISILAPQDGGVVTQTQVDVIGVLDEPANVTVNGNGLGLVTSFNTPVTLQQGANDITVTATDTSGNVATTILSVTVDSRVPSPPNIGKVTLSEPAAGQVAFSGSAGAAEPGATLRFFNISTGTTVTATADGTGAFAHQFGANQGDRVEVTSVDAAGNTSDAVTYTVGAQVQIVSPAQNVIVGGSQTAVTGVFVGGTDSGVTVNGAQACVFGNTFTINEFPLQAGDNTLTATLADASGTIGQHAVTVTGSATPSGVTLTANEDCGLAPLAVNFDVDSGGLGIQKIEIDFDGDGDPDFSTTDVTAAINTTYGVPGIYPATVWVLDNQGTEHAARVNIVARDEAAEDDIFQQVWSNFSTALAAGDINGALDAVKITARGFYEPVLQALVANLPEIAGDLSGIEKIRVEENFAEYAVLTVVDGQVRTFVVTFAKDNDGLWRIVSM